MTTCRHAALQPAGGGSRSVTGGLRAYMTPQRGENIGDTAGAGMRQYRGPDTGGFQGKAGRGSPMLHTAHIHSPQNWSPPTNGRGRRMSGGVEERIGGSGSRLAAPTKLEQRSSPQTSKGMEEIWWGNELEKGKEAQYELGDALIEQKLEISRPLKDTETQVAKKSGITPKVTPKESSSNPLITDTPLADPDGDDQGYVEIEVVPLETDHKLEEGITSHAFPAELMEGAAKEYIFRTEDIETETEPARSGNEQDFRDIRELIRALPTKTDIQELISTVERSCKQAVEDLREEIVAVRNRVEVLEEDQIKQAMGEVQEIIKQQEDMLNAYRDQLDDIRNRDRRQNIRIRDLPEKYNNKDLLATVQKCFSQIFGPSMLEPVEIESTILIHL